MREVSSDPDLAQKPLGTQCRREFRVEDFDSDGTVVPKVCSQVYGRHAARADLPLDGVAVSKCGFQVFKALGHPELRCVKQRKLERDIDLRSWDIFAAFQASALAKGRNVPNLVIEIVEFAQ